MQKKWDNHLNKKEKLFIFKTIFCSFSSKKKKKINIKMFSFLFLISFGVICGLVLGYFSTENLGAVEKMVLPIYYDDDDDDCVNYNNYSDPIEKMKKQY